MKDRRMFNVLSVLALGAVFCSIADFAPSPVTPESLTPQVSGLQTEVAVQLTQAASASPALLTGSIAGRLSYPSEALPAMRVTAFDIATNESFYVDTAFNQLQYQLTDLPAGTYHVIAYSLGGGGFPFGLAGAYTAAVPCGLAADCTSHKLIPVVLQAGQSLTDIDPTDWYGGSSDFPPFPGPVPEGETIPTAPSGGGGTIQGSLSFPSEIIPSLAVVAFRVGGGPADYHYVTTKEGQGTFSIPVPDGEYFVVVYAMNGDLAGGYSQAVLCGLQAGCDDHALIPVSVSGGSVATGIDPGDWYAPDGSFPPYPLP